MVGADRYIPQVPLEDTYLGPTYHKTRVIGPTSTTKTGHPIRLRLYACIRSEAVGALLRWLYPRIASSKLSANRPRNQALGASWKQVETGLEARLSGTSEQDHRQRVLRIV